MAHKLNLKIYLVIFCCLGNISNALAQQNGKWGDQGDGNYRNPVIAGDYSDPDVVRVGHKYYMVCSTFESSPGVTILQSFDLVNWKAIGAVFKNLNFVDSSFSDRRMSRYNLGVYAPSIRYHNGRFWVFVNFYSDGFWMATASDPSGKWTISQIKDKHGRLLKTSGWTDPCPFWDADGKAYLASSRPGACWFSYLFQMSPDGKYLLDADLKHMSQKDIVYRYPDGGTLLSPYHSSEGNKIYKRNGFYYLFHIEFLDKGLGRGTYIFRSKCIYGMKTDGRPGGPGDPGLYEIHKVSNDGDQQLIPGQGGLVDTPDGRWFYMAQFNRYNSDGRCPELLPVVWVDDWPVFGGFSAAGSGRMSWQYKKPVAGFPIQLSEGSDEFTSPELNPKWLWNHQPDPKSWSLRKRKGWLTLYARKPVAPGGFFQAANTICQRHLRSDSNITTVKVDIGKMTAGQKVGLVHFNGGKSYSMIGTQMTSTSKNIFFEKNKIQKSGDKLAPDQLVVYLKTIDYFDNTCNFFYSTDGVTYKPFGDGYRLSSGNYRGDMVGISTYNELNNSGIINVDWFKTTTFNK